MKNLNLQSACLKCGRPRCPLPSEVGWGQPCGAEPRTEGACADCRRPGHWSASIEKRRASLVAQW